MDDLSLVAMLERSTQDPPPSLVSEILTNTGQWTDTRSVLDSHLESNPIEPNPGSQRRSLLVATIAAALVLLIVAGVAISRVDSNHYLDTASETADQLSSAAIEFATSYGQAVHMDSGLDFSTTATISSVEQANDAFGVGTVTGVRSDIAIDHGNGDQEGLLVFEIETTDTSEETVLLALPGSKAVSVEKLNAALGTSRPSAYYVGRDYPLPGKAKVVSLSGAEVAGRLLAAPPMFPLIVGVQGADVASSITSTDVIPASPVNLEALRRAGLSVNRIKNAPRG